MKSTTFLAFLLASPGLVRATSICTKKSTSTTAATKQSPGCNADNCARAVTGTFRGPATQSAHRADCSSFLRCTAYPATVTVTKTTTTFPSTVTVTPSTVTETDVITVSTVEQFDPVSTQISYITDITTDLITLTSEVVVTSTLVADKRDAAPLVIVSPTLQSSVVCPTAVPTYASACSGTARFSSACSCFGVSKTTTTKATPTTTITQTIIGQTTVTASYTTVVTELVSQTVTIPTTIVSTQLVSLTQTIETTILSTSIDSISVPVATVNAYCENGQGVDGLSVPCTAAGCSTVNLRIEGSSGTLYEGIILNGPKQILTTDGTYHQCDGTNDGANPVPGENSVTALDAAAMLCGFTYAGQYVSQFDDIEISRIGDDTQVDSDYWGDLPDLVFPPAGGCETEVSPTTNLLWAWNAFNVNYFLQVEPVNTAVVLTPGQSTTFTVQGADGQGDPLVNIEGATFAGQTSDANGLVSFTAPTTPGTYRYKATRDDSIRSNAVVVVVQG